MTHRSRNKLRRRVGFRYEELQQRTMLASFTAASGSEPVIISFDDGRPATIEINGEPFENPDETLVLTFEGGDPIFGIDGSVELRGDDFQVVSSATQHLVNSGAVSILGLGVDLTTDNGNDEIDIVGALGAFTKYYFQTGGGDDVVNIKGSFTVLELDLGAGDDRVTVRSNAIPTTQGGAGFDQLEIILDAPFSGFTYHEGWIQGIEQVSMPDFFTGQTSQPIHRLELGGHESVIVNGSSARVTSELGETTEYVNFNAFDSRIPGTTNYDVRASNYRLYFQNADQVMIGGGFALGDTSQVLEQVIIDSANQVVISDSSSTDPHAVFLSKSNSPEVPSGSNLILGLTAKAIFVARTNRTVLAGGDGVDRFFVSQFDSQLTLYGNAGDDRFFIGHNQNNASKNLAVAGSFVHIVAGEGNDYLRADDTGSTANRRFRLRDHWIHTSGDSANKQFGGIFFSGLERVELKANANSTRFYFSPSVETQFTIRGGKPGIPFNLKYQLDAGFVSQSYFFSPAPGRFVYWFGQSGLRFIQVYPS